MPGPAATVQSMHTCPMLNPGTPPSPHVGGPVSGPGVPSVLIGGKPAAVMGDQCVCSGPPDMIVEGDPTVLIGGKPIATVGCRTAHGGVITTGEPTVLIGTGCSAPTAIKPLKDIPFPKMSGALKTTAALSGRSKTLKEAQKEQDAIREETLNNEGEPLIYALDWKKEDTRIRKSTVLKKVLLTAKVHNIEEGETVTLKVKKPKTSTDEHGKTTVEQEEYLELSGTVKDKEVVIEHELEEIELQEKKASDSSSS